jgi:hypothetical protein
MLDVYNGGLTSTHPSVDAPQGSLKVPLRRHQQTALKGMEDIEQRLIAGHDISGQRLYGDHAVLGDSVGVGKSLMVLGHIARVAKGVAAPIISRTHVQHNSSSHLFSLKTTTYTDLSEAGSLIVVPHTLFRQWAEYIKKQTNLSHILLDKVKVFDVGATAGATTDTDAAAATTNTAKTKLIKDIMGAEVVLISNTLYKHLARLQTEQGITWKRVFFDEADTIHMIQGHRRPVSRFTWFITASWMNVIFANETIIFPQWALDTTVFQDGHRFAPLRPYFTGLKPTVHGAGQTAYHYLRFNLTSYGYFRDIMEGSHPLRGHTVLRCTDQYIQESISLPPLHVHHILCKVSLTQQIVGDAVPREVQNLLHAGDVTGAMEALGVKTEDTTNLIDAVTINLQKELSRLEATLAFKSSLEYATQASKESALTSLQEKIKRVKDQISTIRSRIEGFKEELCPICYDEPQEATVTPCCSQVFCGQCILTCLTRGRSCPMCREGIHPSKLTKIVIGVAPDANAIVEAGSGAGAAAGPQIEKKPETLMRLFRENPEGRFLVFSRYDNPFSSIEKSAVDELGLTVRQLKGNKDMIASTLNAFDRGTVRCLLLNSHYAGSGLNITAATHVVLLHAMTIEEEKQILGRAYRMGRKGPLQFIKLLHENEVTMEA